MTDPTFTCPLFREQVADMYFMEHRAKLIDIAAYLDRLDRARPEGDGCDDFRTDAFRRALEILIDEQPERARRLLELFSDPTLEPITSAAGMKGAVGAYQPANDTGSEAAP